MLLKHQIKTTLLFPTGAQETDGEELEGVWHKDVINHTLTLTLLLHIHMAAYYVIIVSFFVFKPHCFMKEKKLKPETDGVA